MTDVHILFVHTDYGLGECTVCICVYRQIADVQIVCTDELVVYCRPSQLQLDIYQAILDHSDVQLILQQNHMCDCGSGTRRIKCCHKVRKIPACNYTKMAQISTLLVR